MRELINQIWQEVLSSDSFVPTNPNAIEHQLQNEVLVSAINGRDFDIRLVYDNLLSPAQ